MAKSNILLKSGTNELEIVEFYMDETAPGAPANASAGGRNYYGINVAKVLEIIRSPQLTDLPEAASPAVLGAFNLRERIIPLVDLGVWLRRPPVDGAGRKVIVTEFNKITTAFAVSGVTRIHRISWEDVEAPSPYVAALAGNSITGVVRLENRIIYILDMEKIVADLNPEPMEIEATEPRRKELIRGRNLTALLCDDSSMARNTMKTLLEEAGFKVAAFTNGREAWDQLQLWRVRAREQGDPIRDFVDVVVSDIEMPVMDGHNLTLRIKEDHALRELPVVLCSSIITEALRHKGESVGADAQVSKVDMNQLVGTILGILGMDAVLGMDGIMDMDAGR
ncbi:MAG: chemotaxis protein [Desulfovibrionaceae bacterium]